MKTTTAELTRSRSQMQGGTQMIVTGCCHLRIEPGGSITVHTPLSCFLLSLQTFTRKDQIPACPKTFCQWNSPHEDVFLSNIHTVLVSVCSVNSQLKDVHVIHRRIDIILPCFISGFCFCCCFWMLLHVSGVILRRQWCFLCVCLCCLLAWLWLSVWPVNSPQRPSPGLTTRSMDMSWWKTWVTRFMVIRAADENGKARAGLKKNEPFSLLYFCSKRRQEMRNTDMSGDSVTEKIKSSIPPAPRTKPSLPTHVGGKTKKKWNDCVCWNYVDETKPK